MRYIIALLLSLIPAYAEEDSLTIKTNPNATILAIPSFSPKNLIFTNGNKTFVSINLSTGKVTLAEGIELDQATKEFWKIVEKNIPACIKVEYK